MERKIFLGNMTLSQNAEMVTTLEDGEKRRFILDRDMKADLEEILEEFFDNNFD